MPASRHILYCRGELPLMLAQSFVLSLYSLHANIYFNAVK